MANVTLVEKLSFDQANCVVESKDDGNGNKNLFMEGIFVQGEKRNQNQRVYPVSEIQRLLKIFSKELTRDTQF